VSWSVLIVDDEPMTRDLLRMMLRPAGFDIFEAEDGVDALEKIKQRQPDVIILDVMMPNLDGINTCIALRQQPETADLPVLMLSAKTHLNAVEEGMRAGATRYLSKPVSRKELIDHINDVLGVPSP
jgi:CheY-like chemotaxis protein